jgi:hypothetical protein
MVLAGTARCHVGVTVWFPWPVFAAALYTFVAVGAVDPAGSVYGYVIPFVASVHAEPLSQASLGALVIVVADVDNVLGVPPPVENVVDVAVMFHPAPDPVASPTSRACVVVTDWSAPFNVALKLTAGGADTNAKEPADIVAVADVAPAGVANPSSAPAPNTIATSPAHARRFAMNRLLDSPSTPPSTIPEIRRVPETRRVAKTRRVPENPPVNRELSAIHRARANRP